LWLETGFGLVPYTRTYKYLRRSHWVTQSKNHCNYITQKVFSVFIIRRLVAAANDGRSLSSGFPKCHRAQLQPSHFSQLQLSNDWTTFQVKIMLRPTVSGPVYLGVKPHLRPKTRIFLCQTVAGSVSQSQSYFTTGDFAPIRSSWQQAPWDSRPVILFSNWTLEDIVLMKHHLWREDRSVVYNCCWPSSAQSFSGPRPVGLMTIFYCFRFQNPQNWRARSPYLHPPGTGWPSYNPKNGVPFLSPHMTRRAMVEVFEPASTTSPRYIGLARTAEKTSLP
jgi:hypothetical protein